MKTTIHKLQYRLEGDTFGARGCSVCACNPCDCNPCDCSRTIRSPRWRVSGYALRTGTIDILDISDLLILSLAHPLSLEDHADWTEALLVDAKARPEQVTALLRVLENMLTSIPAEVDQTIVTARAVYQVPMTYRQGGRGPNLTLCLTPESPLLRAGTPHHPLTWEYNGPMALREHFTLTS